MAGKIDLSRTLQSMRSALPLPSDAFMYWLFRDRQQAGESLAERLLASRWAKSPPERLFGLARGGVAVAAPVARKLHCPLEVLVVRKIGAPDNEEFGVGAICEDGSPLFSQETLRALQLKPEDLFEAARRKISEASEKMKIYRGSTLTWSKIPRSVLVIDDGLATGISAEAAARFLRQKGVGRLTLAVPVAAADSARALRKAGELYDEVIALERLANLGSVGSWYENFDPVSDEEVLRLLKSSREIAA